MSISDIITLLSLVIAILAILSEKNRRHILLKFHRIDYLIFSVAFILINYFVFYKSFFNRGIYISGLYFPNFGLKNPENWAYIITLVTVSYFFYKIWYAFYPFSKIEKVISYYQRLIENNDTSFLLDLIDKYHKNDIIKSINNTKDYEPDKNWWETRFSKKTIKQKFNEKLRSIICFSIPGSWVNKRSYARMVIYNILNNPAFLILASRQRPYLFAEIIASFKEVKREGFPKEITNAFLEELLRNKDFWIKKELIESQRNDPTQPESFYSENRILGALITDLSVADVNEVWRPFGEAAITEIEDERTKGYDSKMYNDYTEDDLLWEFVTYYSIQFFYLLINEAITKKYTGSHFFMFYYDRIVNAILKNFNKRPPEDFEKITTQYHKLIEIILYKSFYWLEQSNQAVHPGIYHDILDCIGTNIDQVTKNRYYGLERQLSILDTFLNNYCDIEDNEEAEELRKKYEEKLLRPSMLTESHAPYYKLIAIAWNKFDKIPHRSMQGHGDDLDYFARLKEKVIIPLGLDPHEY